MPEVPHRPAAALVERIGETVVGLRREVEILAVAMGTGRHVLMEGPPGSGKSTLLGRLAAETGRRIEFVEGNAELTPGRLIGQFDPALVLNEGYRPEFFLDGPLVSALRNGSWLYVEEFNRIPEETLNVLLTVLAEGELHVPRLGHVRAAPGFWLVSAMNPFDAVGTARISQAVADRMCRVSVGYQDVDAERRIAAQVSGVDGTVTDISVAVGRATREHPRLRTGSSVRGAIDMTLLATGLADLRGCAPRTLEVLEDAAVSAFSGRVALDDASDDDRDVIVLDILRDVLQQFEDDEDPQDEDPQDEGPDDDGDRPDGQDGPSDGAAPDAPGGDDEAPSPSAEDDSAPPAWTPPTPRPRTRGQRTVSRRELGLHHPAFEDVAPEGAAVDEQAFDELLASRPDEALPLLAEMTRATDPALRRSAAALAARVFVRAGRSGAPARRAIRRLGWRVGEGSGDVDLERTIERAGGRPRDREAIVTRDWQGCPRDITLVIDRSGSMTGTALANAALAAAAVSLAVEVDGTCRIIAFADEATTLYDSARDTGPRLAVERVLTLEGHGRTNLAEALRATATCRSREGSHRPHDAIVLSDCVVTVGDAPASALGGLDRVHVLNPSAEPEGTEAGRRLAQRGHGRFEAVENVGQITAALSRILSVA